jgi:hypothetical protein
MKLVFISLLIHLRTTMDDLVASTIDELERERERERERQRNNR